MQHYLGMKDRLNNCLDVALLGTKVKKYYLFNTSPFSALISRRSSSSVEGFSVALGGIIDGR